MYITNNIASCAMDSIISYMPHSLRKYLYGIDISQVNEIHLCPGKPMLIYYPDTRKFISCDGELTDNPYEAARVTQEDIREAMEIASKSSVYSVEEEIRNGYITVDGGHRIGICGSAVIRDGKITFVRDISALNYRLAREIKGAAQPVIEAVLRDGEVKNTLIISPPGAGKTTMLRDMVRLLSDEEIRVCVVDERREIAAMCNGRCGFDLGCSTTVFSGVPKAAGMLMMLRAMSPDVIVTDEIGTSTDAAAITRIINSGTKVITTVHGYSLEQIKARSDLKAALPYFETFICLSKANGAGTLESLIEL